MGRARAALWGLLREAQRSQGCRQPVLCVSVFQEDGRRRSVLVMFPVVFLKELWSLTECGPSVLVPEIAAQPLLKAT